MQKLCFMFCIINEYSVCLSKFIEKYKLYWLLMKVTENVLCVQHNKLNGIFVTNGSNLM